MANGSAFPLIMAGPILRRVDPSTVTVWLALSASRTVELGIWSGDVMAGTTNNSYFGLSNAAHTHSTTPIRIGEKLYLCLIHMDLSSSPLGAGNTYSYNISFTGGGSPEDLNSLGLLKDAADGKSHLGLGYQSRKLPSFVIAPLTLNGLNVCHTSCRKAHGYGKDSLAAMDKFLKKNINNAAKRPHALFLTGDQVYADDVAMCLLPSLTDVGKTLLGKDEKLKIDASTEVLVDKNNLPSGRRKKLCFDKVKFSSGESRSHVLAFGEFCALYLFSWSRELWPSSLPDAETVLAGGSPPSSLTNFLDSLPTEEDEIEKWKKDYDGEKAKVESYKKTLVNVRRLLANVPSYMIFDDHEITDDWYLTQEWKDRVLASPLGKNVLRNGLTAFALFQAWGNDPVRFQTGTYANLLTQAQALFPSAASEGPNSSAAGVLDGIYGLSSSSATDLVKWHFVVPCGPSQALILDTRTRRSFKGNYSPPGLLDDLAMLEILNDTLRPSAGAEVLFIISPAPVLGLGIFEELIQPLAARVVDAIHVFKSTWDPDKPDHNGKEGADYEAWGLEPAVFEKFLKRIEAYKKVVFLSGDVHYGFSAEMDYWKQGESSPTRLVQLTASAAKNEVHKWQKFLFTGGTIQKIFAGTFMPAERLGWENSSSLIGEINIPGGTPPPGLRTRLKLNPTLLSPHHLPQGTTFNIPPEWAWRLNILKDKRPDDSSPEARPADGRDQLINPDLDNNDAAVAYVSVLQSHEKALEKNFGRRIVWGANFGLLKFSGTGDTLKVKHQLMFMHPEEDKPNDPQAYTVHELSLAPSTDSIPGSSLIIST